VTSGIAACRRGALTRALAMVTLIALLAACGGSSSTPKSIDAPRVARAIAATIHHQRGVSAQVTCPTGVPLAAHRQFRCVAEVGSRDTPFLVTERDASGHVAYVGVSPSRTQLLNTAKVAAAIQRSISSQRKVSTTVRCPSDIPMQRGLPFICTATSANGRHTEFDVTQTAGGHVTYKAR
jgi:hypothetical protein